MRTSRQVAVAGGFEWIRRPGCTRSSRCFASFRCLRTGAKTAARPRGAPPIQTRPVGLRTIPDACPAVSRDPAPTSVDGLIVVGSPGLILDDVEIIAGEAVPGADGARGTNGSDGAAGGDGICRDAGVSGFAIRCPSSMGGGGGRGGFGRGIGRAGRTPVIGLAFGGAGGSEREDGEPGGNGAVLRRRPSTGDSAQFDGDVDPANERWEFASVAEAGRDGGTGGGGAGGGGGVSAPPGEAPSSRTGGGGGAGGNGGCAGGGGNLGRNGGAGGRGQDGSNGSGGTTSSGGRGANGEVDTVRGCE